MITTEQKQLITATVPVLREHGLLLTTHFYSRMFKHNPELKNIFNMGNQQNSRQQTALAMAVLAYAENIDDPSVLMPVVGTIGQKHTSLDIRPEHYQIVGKHLILSIGEVLGEAATPQILEAWTVAYNQLAALMSGHESKIYSQKAQQEGGWTGWKPFIVKSKIAESSEITSFYLYPADGGKVADFLPGQFISVRMFLPELNMLQPRQYSISSAPNGSYYRISVKRERRDSAVPDGMISNRLHDFVIEGDSIEVTAPSGSFTLAADNERPVVFISGGIGQTPLISMLEDLINSGSKKSKTWIHGCRNKEVHAFKEVIDSWAAADEGLNKHIFYNILPENVAADVVYNGYVDLNMLDEELFSNENDYYICGPTPFIEKQYHDLISKGVAKNFINFEEFGPQVLNLN